MKNIIFVFAFVGILATCALLLILAIKTIQTVDDKIEDLKYRHRIKHRFDKPPIAKCYCKDCKYHECQTGKCFKLKGWYTADNWFCWLAYPKRKENEE